MFTINTIVDKVKHLTQRITRTDSLWNYFGTYHLSASRAAETSTCVILRMATATATFPHSSGPSRMRQWWRRIPKTCCRREILMLLVWLVLLQFSQAVWRSLPILISSSIWPILSMHLVQHSSFLALSLAGLLMSNWGYTKLLFMEHLLYLLLIYLLL